MSYDRFKRAAEWFHSNIFGEEKIHPRAQSPRDRIPSPIRAARALEKGLQHSWQPREELFLKQAKLLVNYEDDFPLERPVTCYFPTYQSLTDQELRAYFSWRTQLRRGQLRKTSLSYAYLYIYELLNQVGVSDPTDGYWKLKGFQAAYGQLDDRIDFYMDRWLEDYVIYYGLHPALLADSAQLQRDSGILVFAELPNYSDGQLMDAIHQLAGGWLKRSKFYRDHREDYDRVLCGVLRGMYLRAATRCKRTMAEQLFGKPQTTAVRLFDGAVFWPTRRQDREYALDPLCVYRCKDGLWTVTRYDRPDAACQKLEALTKAVDGIMRECFGHRYPIKYELNTQWKLKLIREETEALLAQKQAAQAPKLSIDYSQLEQIRRDAAITRDRLIVEEEQPEEIPAPVPTPVPEPQPETSDTPLTPEETRLLRCLLYGGDLGWVQSSGLMLSVLVDSINEKLYDIFADSVLDDTPEPVEDYIDELKEMVTP